MLNSSLVVTMIQHNKCRSSQTTNSKKPPYFTKLKNSFKSKYKIIYKFIKRGGSPINDFKLLLDLAHMGNIHKRIYKFMHYLPIYDFELYCANVIKLSPSRSLF